MFAAWTVSLPWPVFLVVVLLAVVGVVYLAFEAAYGLMNRKDGDQ